MSLEKLRELEKLYEGQNIGRLSFSVKVSGFFATVKEIPSLLSKRFLKKIFN